MKEAQVLNTLKCRMSVPEIRSSEFTREGSVKTYRGCRKARGVALKNEALIEQK